MKTFHRGLGAALMLCSSSLFAGPFLGAALDHTSTVYSNIKDSSGYSILGGYESDSATFPLFLEASYYDSGKLKVKDSGGLSFSYSGPQVFAGGGFKSPSGSLAWLKVGYYSFDGKTAVADIGSVSGSTKGLTLGVGFDWHFSPEVALRLGIETPMKVDSTPGISQADAEANGITKEEKQLSVLQLGLVWRPLAASSRIAQRPSSSAYTLPLTRTAATTPPPVLLTAFKPGSEALARPGSVLRAAPLESSEVIQNLSPSPVLKLESSIVNASGEWWFVISDIERGWLRADELLKP